MNNLNILMPEVGIWQGYLYTIFTSIQKPTKNTYNQISWWLIDDNFTEAKQRLFFFFWFYNKFCNSTHGDAIFFLFFCFENKK